MPASLKVRRARMSALKLDERNARLHSDRNLDSIAASLERFGQVRPILVGAEGRIIAGNGTYSAALALGWKMLDVVDWVGPEDDETIRAYALADNRTAELAIWDVAELVGQLAELEPAGLLEAAGWNDDERDDAIADAQEAELAGRPASGLLKRPGPDAGDESFQAYLDRYRDKALRGITVEYPTDVYGWLVRKLQAFRDERGIETNSEAVAELIGAYYQEDVPWPT